MKPREIIPDVHYVGVPDFDRRLFDALIPLPDGTSYNSYLVRRPGQDRPHRRGRAPRCSPS